MTKDQIKEEFPEIISCPIAVGKGWLPHIYWLCNWLQFHVRQNDHPPIKAVQIKEKFGGLRFYTDSTTDMQHGAIAMIESLCERTCESCGAMKNVGKTTDGWIQTLCGNCVDKDKYGWKPIEVTVDEDS